MSSITKKAEKRTTGQQQWEGQLAKEKRTVERKVELGKLTLSDPALKRSFKGHKQAVNCTRFNPGLNQVISGSNDGTVMVWNFKSGISPFRFVGHKGPVNSVCVSPDGKTIVSGSGD